MVDVTSTATGSGLGSEMVDATFEASVLRLLFGSYTLYVNGSGFRCILKIRHNIFVNYSHIPTVIMLCTQERMKSKHCPTVMVLIVFWQMGCKMVEVFFNSYLII